MNMATTTLDLIDEKNDTLEIKLQPVDEIPGGLVLYLKGYIDTYNSPYFQRHLLKAIEAGFKRLAFNLSGITYISSTGIGIFALLLKEVRKVGGDVSLSALIPRVSEVFKLLGFANFFHFTDTVDESLKHLNSQSQEGRTGPFPRIFSCPICRKKLKAPREGRFRCSECKTVLKVDRSGQVTIG